MTPDDVTNMNKILMDPRSAPRQPPRARSRRRFLGILATALSVGPLLGGCASAAVQEQPMAISEIAQMGARIWLATCDRCHNARPASEFTAEQWPVLVAHVRSRAHLTRSEARAVTAFLVELSASGP